MPRKKAKSNDMTINVKVKSVKKHAGSKEHVASVLEREHENPTSDKKKIKMPEKVIPLEYPFFIRTYSGGFALCEVNKNAAGYNSLAYASRLEQMFSIAVNYQIRIPMEVQELSDKLDHLYSMLKARVENVGVKDLFEEYRDINKFVEDFK